MMPNFDGTGPRGEGPLTGGGGGFCVEREEDVRPKIAGDRNPRGFQRPPDGRGRAVGMPGGRRGGRRR